MASTGFIYNGIDSSAYSLVVKTTNIPLFSSKKVKMENVLQRDGAYRFADKHNEKPVIFNCTINDTLDYSQRRYLVRDIAAWLDTPSTLICNYEPDKQYNARLDDQVDLEMLVEADNFKLTFMCHSVAESVFYNDSIVWEDATIPWEQLNIPWDGYATEFDLTTPTTVNVYNIGNYECLPLIKLTNNEGTPRGIAITDTYGNVLNVTNVTNGTPIYVDCKEKLCYSLSGGVKTNQRSKLSSSGYTVLKAGVNAIYISGSATDYTVEFIYRNTYI